MTLQQTPRWKDGAQCAVVLSFDPDAETLALARDPENARRPGLLSQGRYGPMVALPEILALLAEYWHQQEATV